MLHVSNISKAYGDHLILDKVSFVVNAGERVGLIGPNGCGKSTLLRIITGREHPDGGSVQLSPAGTRPGYLEQGLLYEAGESIGDLLYVYERAVEAAEERVATLAGRLARTSGAEQARLMEAYSEALADLERLAVARPQEHEAEAVLAGLGLAEVPLETPVAILSGGQKTRVGLARLLLNGPDLLLLDEPTNHLDIEALEWLEGWLRDYPGAVLIVSHDRTFLDNTVTRILDLEPESHTVTEYVGNYSDYIVTWEQRREKQWAEWQDQREEVRRLGADIHRTKQQALSVELTTTPGQPTVRRYAKKVAKKAKSREKKLERYLESDERVEKPKLTWQMKLEFLETPESGQDVLVLEELAAGYAGVPLFEGASEILGAGERVALVGPNGAGKTTLLKVILGQLPPLEGRARLGAKVKVGYYAQEQETLPPDGTPFSVIRSSAPMSETDARSFLHYFLFSGDDVFRSVHSLSYGERARLVLARLVATGCNFLILDEPINHLDIPSRERFEQAMAAYEGTVLAVVHDRYFIRRFASRVWQIAGGRLRSCLDLEETRRTQRADELLF
ncbi:MAG: ribosomal protection-like ABC-F family protein [Anaerolineales bacterium]